MVAEYKRGGLWIINHPRVEAMLQAVIVHTAAVTTVQLLLQLSHRQSRQLNRSWIAETRLKCMFKLRTRYNVKFKSQTCFVYFKNPFPD
jgi:hypothetical protein